MSVHYASESSDDSGTDREKHHATEHGYFSSSDNDDSDVEDYRPSTIHLRKSITSPEHVQNAHPTAYQKPSPTYHPLASTETSTQTKHSKSTLESIQPTFTNIVTKRTIISDRGEPTETQLLEFNDGYKPAIITPKLSASKPSIVHRVDSQRAEDLLGKNNKSATRFQIPRYISNPTSTFLAPQPYSFQKNGKNLHG